MQCLALGKQGGLKPNRDDAPKEHVAGVRSGIQNQDREVHCHCWGG